MHEYGNIPFSVKHVDKLLELSNVKNLNQEENQPIHKIFAKYSYVFYLVNDLPMVTNICKQSIHLKKDARPVYVKPYKLPHAPQSEIRKQIDKLLSGAIIDVSKDSSATSQKKIDCNIKC